MAKNVSNGVASGGQRAGQRGRWTLQVAPVRCLPN